MCSSTSSARDSPKRAVLEGHRLDVAPHRLLLCGRRLRTAPVSSDSGPGPALPAGIVARWRPVAITDLAAPRRRARVPRLCAYDATVVSVGGVHSTSASEPSGWLSVVRQLSKVTRREGQPGCSRLCCVDRISHPSAESLLARW